MPGQTGPKTCLARLALRLARLVLILSDWSYLVLRLSVWKYVVLRLARPVLRLARLVKEAMNQVHGPVYILECK